ncbi:1638_t:CDS:2, partial [Acaulospora morrowiae]
QDGHMVISDFGCSSSLVHLNEMIPFIEPLYLKDQSYCLDRRSDIYSFGGIMSELSCGRPPFELFGSNYQLLINLIVNGDRDSSVISGAPVSYTQLYRRCWDADPSKRPTIENVMKLLTDIRSEFPKVLTKPPADIPHQANPRHHAIKNIQSLSVPAISPRVDSIGWRDSMGDFSEYDVISKEEVKGYSGSTRKVNSVPLVGGVSLNSRRRVKARSLSFGTPRKSLQVQRAHESAHLQLHHSMSMIGGINNEYLNIGANAPLFDNNQPKVILIARYCPGKSIVKVFDQLKRRKIDLRSREAYKSKSVFHSLIWNDDLFEVTGINHSQQKPARHSNFRAALKWLISNNLDINSVDDFGWTALHEAIWKRKEPGVILALLENQANPNIPDKLGATPLHQCLDLLRTTTRDDENRHIFTIIKLLLQYGADPNLALPDTTLTISGSSFPNCLFAAIYMDLPLDIIELMIKQGADTTSTTFRGLHLLDFAAKMNNVVALNYLTDNKNSSNISKRSSIFNSLRINSRVGSMGSIPIKYEKGGRKKRWSIIRSI